MSATAMTPTMGLGRPIQCNDVGSGPASLVTVEEYSPPGIPLRQTKFTFNSATLTFNDNGTTGSGGLQVYDFPKGNITVLNAVSKLTYSISGSLTDAGLVSSVGSVTAAADGTLTSTEADIIASTATASTSGAATFSGRLSAAAFLNGTSTAADLFLNLASANDPVGAKTVTVTGWLIVTWINGGDNTIS